MSANVIDKKSSKKLSQVEINRIIRSHKKWILGDIKGNRAKIENVEFSNLDLISNFLERSLISNVYIKNTHMTHINFKNTLLKNAVISNTDLSSANFRHAILENVTFKNCNLNEADFKNTMLENINIVNCSMTGANLKGINVENIKISESEMLHMDLRNAELYDIDIKDTNIKWSDLTNATLESIRTTNIKSNFPIACPEEGSFIGWKKCEDNLIVKLEIPSDAKRSSGTSRKCRASKAKVLEIQNMDGTKANGNTAISIKGLTYAIGKTVHPDFFDENRWNECSNGIHFFHYKR